MDAFAQLAVASPGPADDGFVLVVDDDEINRTVVLALVAQRELQTAIACDGQEAIEMVARDHYDAILMDCLMPQLDGFQATRQIRAAEYGSRVTIIAMTALAGPGDRERCLAAGMDDYLSKPLVSAQLDAALDRWLAPAASRVISVAREPLDQAAVLQLRDTLTPAVRAHLVEVFEQQQADCLSQIAAAAQLGDRDRVRRVAHLLKGSSATLGAAKLRACCQELEHMNRRGDGDMTEQQVDQLQLVAAEASVALRDQLLSEPDGAPSGVLPLVQIEITR